VPPLLFYLWKKARDSLMKQEHDGGVNVEIKEPKRSATGLPAIASSVSRSLRELGPVDAARTLSGHQPDRGFRLPGLRMARTQKPSHGRVLREWCQGGCR
jgi:hypothetical protein